MGVLIITTHALFLMQSTQCYKPPQLGPTAGSVPTEETATLVGPMFTPKGMLHSRSETTLSIPVTISRIHNHSKTSNRMKCVAQVDALVSFFLLPANLQ